MKCDFCDNVSWSTINNLNYCFQCNNKFIEDLNKKIKEIKDKEQGI